MLESFDIVEGHHHVRGKTILAARCLIDKEFIDIGGGSLDLAAPYRLSPVKRSGHEVWVWKLRGRSLESAKGFVSPRYLSLEALKRYVSRRRRWNEGERAGIFRDRYEKLQAFGAQIGSFHGLSFNCGLLY
jgi:hypothetical protein